MPAQFATATDLLDALRFAFSADADGAAHYRMMNRLKSVSCLVIDDLGKERPIPFGVERLAAIIHWRHAATAADAGNHQPGPAGTGPTGPGHIIPAAGRHVAGSRVAHGGAGLPPTRCGVMTDADRADVAAADTCELWELDALIALLRSALAVQV